MNRTTIDFGIDLGTTNSSIAVLKGIVPEVIRNNLENEITSSAVHISEEGDMQVGLFAKQRLENGKDLEDTRTEFKRLMGTGKNYEFKSSGQVMTPEELSAEVLKSLKGDVQQRLGEVVQSAVITVPAAFELKQCMATKKAGELAGFSLCPLILEPVAAALAYGFQTDVTKEYWLVYDFGGGTFDAALVKAEDGTISVKNNGGDNLLGGSDIDWAIIEKLFLPQIKGQFNLPNFTRGNQQWKTAFALIKAAVEGAKIRLSRSDSAYIECNPFLDADGESVEIKLKLTRDALVNIAEPIIMSSARICQRVLKEKNLSPSAVEKMILVGGPTLAPYFRDILYAALGIPLDHSINPLTVVSQGAAIFAGTQQIVSQVKAKAGEFTLDLKYKSIGPDEDPLVRGSVVAENGSDTGGFVIEFVNEKTKWRSRRIPLKAEGAFKVNLIAEKGSQNVFLIELYDPQGTKQITVPDRLTYIIGAPPSDLQVINPIGLGLANNDFDILFKKGDPLPIKATENYHTTVALKKGHTGEFLRIPVYEGESTKADRNRLQGTLKISANNIKRDLPADSEVDVTLYMNEERLIQIKAYISMLDEEFEAKIDIKCNPKPPDQETLKKELREEKQRLKKLRENAENDEAMDAVEDLVDELEELVDAADGDESTATKAAHKLLEVKIAIDEIEDGLCMSTLADEAHGALDELDKLIEAHGDAEQGRRAAKLRAEVEELIEQKNADRLRKKIEQVGGLHGEIIFSQDAVWVALFEDVAGRKNCMKDQSLADRFIGQGRQCRDHNNIQGLKAAVVQLMDLMPQQEKAEAQSTISDILRG